MNRRALLEGWTAPAHPRVKRSGSSYQQTDDFVRSELARHVQRYRELDSHDQTARLIRDEIDDLLRRYHDYCIEQNQGAHYRQRGLGRDIDTEFEHIIPAKVARDALITGRMTVDDALNIPTCDLSAAKHRELADTGLTKTTPDPYWFWRRYRDLGVEIETRDGIAVDLDTWNLDTHYEYFGHQS
jgi:hypothetical protein